MSTASRRHAEKQRCAPIISFPVVPTGRHATDPSLLPTPPNVGPGSYNTALSHSAIEPNSPAALVRGKPSIPSSSPPGPSPTTYNVIQNDPGRFGQSGPAFSIKPRRVAPVPFEHVTPAPGAYEVRSPGDIGYNLPQSRNRKKKNNTTSGSTSFEYVTSKFMLPKTIRTQDKPRDEPKPPRLAPFNTYLPKSGLPPGVWPTLPLPPVSSFSPFTTNTYDRERNGLPRVAMLSPTKIRRAEEALSSSSTYGRSASSRRDSLSLGQEQPPMVFSLDPLDGVASLKVKSTTTVLRELAAMREKKTEIVLSKTPNPSFPTRSVRDSIRIRKLAQEPSSKENISYDTHNVNDSFHPFFSLIDVETEEAEEKRDERGEISAVPFSLHDLEETNDLIEDQGYDGNMATSFSATPLDIIEAHAGTGADFDADNDTYAAIESVATDNVNVSIIEQDESYSVRDSDTDIGENDCDTEGMAASEPVGSYNSTYKVDSDVNTVVTDVSIQFSNDNLKDEVKSLVTDEILHEVETPLIVEVVEASQDTHAHSEVIEESVKKSVNDNNVNEIVEENESEFVNEVDLQLDLGRQHHRSYSTSSAIDDLLSGADDQDDMALFGTVFESEMNLVENTADIIVLPHNQEEDHEDEPDDANESMYMMNESTTLTPLTLDDAMEIPLPLPIFSPTKAAGDNISSVSSASIAAAVNSGIMAPFGDDQTKSMISTDQDASSLFQHNRSYSFDISDVDEPEICDVYSGHSRSAPLLNHSGDGEIELSDLA